MHASKLARHLQRKHPIKYEEFQEDEAKDKVSPTELRANSTLKLVGKSLTNAESSVSEVNLRLNWLTVCFRYFDQKLGLSSRLKILLKLRFRCLLVVS